MLLRYFRGAIGESFSTLGMEATVTGRPSEPTLDSYASGTGGTPLLGDTIGRNLDRAIAAHPDREALVDVPSGRRWTYAEFDAAVDRGGAGPCSPGGSDKGDRVGIWAPNCPEWVLTQYATARIGAILVNINPAYRVHELAYVLRQAGMRTAHQRRPSTRPATTGRWSTRCAAVSRAA